MSGHDWVFWYTGLWAWGAIAILVGVAVIIGLVLAARRVFVGHRDFWWNWTVMAHLKDADIELDDLMRAWSHEFRGDDAARDATMERLGRVRAQIRESALRNIRERGPCRVIRCPECEMHHTDKGEWATKPHRRHLCENCEHEWAPYSYKTIGVEDEMEARRAPYGRDGNGDPLLKRPVSAATVAAEIRGDAAP